MSIVLVLDTETSGTDPKKDRLLEVGVAAYDIEEGSLIDCVSWLVTGTTTPHALAINGISDALLSKHGHEHFIEANDEVARLFEAQASTPIAIIAHGAAFDRQWFAPNVQALPWVCSWKGLEWPRKDRMGSGSLEKLALAHGVGCLPGHRAIHDVLTIVRVLDACCHSEGAPAVERMIRRALRPKQKYQALVSFHNNKEAKEAGFEWDAQRKAWWKDIAIEDVEALQFPFRIVPLNS